MQRLALPKETTPSGLACHPSTGGESGSIAIEPCRTPYSSIIDDGLPIPLRRRGARRAGWFSLAHQRLVKGKEHAAFGASQRNHPVRLRLPPLHRRGIRIECHRALPNTTLPNTTPFNHRRRLTNSPPSEGCPQGGGSQRLTIHGAPAIHRGQATPGRAKKWPESGIPAPLAVPRNGARGEGKGTARCPCFVN